MKERIKNPLQSLVDSCCKTCPLYASKPGVKYYPQNIIAAAESASRLSRIIESGITVTMDGVCARRLTAFLALQTAQNRSDKERINSTSKKSAPKQDAGEID